MNIAPPDDPQSTLLESCDRITRIVRKSLFVNLCSLLLNGGLGLENVLMSWARDWFWLDDTAAAIQLTCAGMAAYWLRLYLRRARACRSLRRNILGFHAASTRSQFDHHNEQIEAAIEAL